jgi:serine/threonine protein kinase
MLVSHDQTDRDPIDLIAEEYAARCRAGEKPTIEEYVARYPDLSDDLRVLLPTVGFLERGRSEIGKARSGEMAAIVRFGDFRVVKEIGRGGMGIVYEAVQEPLGRRVAVKVLPRPSAADARSRERFLREAKAISRLKHPNIVPIFAVGEADNVPYYAMALIDGLGLDRPMSAPKGTVARGEWVANLGKQAAEALAHAHEVGVLHRDVKPANLIIEPDGRVWLTDFGLAKLADDLSLTETGGLPGTLRYMAPECLDGEGDERSDVYSLGLTLYELLLGRPAFGESNRVRLLQQVKDAEPARPRTIDPSIARDLETIILKAMARDPDARYQKAQELADDLRRFLEGWPIRARPVGPIERLGRAVKRNPLIWGLSSAIVLLTLVSVYFVRLYLIAPPPTPPGEAREQRKNRSDDRPQNPRDELDDETIDRIAKTPHPMRPDDIPGRRGRGFGPDGRPPGRGGGPFQKGQRPPRPPDMFGGPFGDLPPPSQGLGPVDGFPPPDLKAPPGEPIPPPPPDAPKKL